MTEIRNIVPFFVASRRWVKEEAAMLAPKHSNSEKESVAGENKLIEKELISRMSEIIIIS